MAEEAYVANLGQVAAIVFLNIAPTNQKILWYDNTEDIIKYYNKSNSSWEPVTSNPETLGKVKVDSSDILSFLEEKFNTDQFKKEYIEDGEGNLVLKISLVNETSQGFFL